MCHLTHTKKISLLLFLFQPLALTARKMKYIILILPLLLAAVLASAQGGGPCTTIGQTPGTAFPVCGVKTFSQANVPICGGNIIPGPLCGSTEHKDVNPFWYKFTCYISGSLGFLITPNNIDDDYDWQLFDITGRNLNEIYANVNLFVGSNWSGEYGLTGASAAGTQREVCGGFGKPLFSSMPNIQQGHEYLLLISHFTQSQSGYELSFNGGTASITDPVTPQVKRVVYHCEKSTISIKLNKRLKCASLQANGTDFRLNGTPAVITNATGVSCNNGFDMDSIVLTLDRPVPPGNYSLTVKQGSDGNTLLDACDIGMASATADFEVVAQPPVPFDSLRRPDCAPDNIHLVFSSPIRCSSIAPNGSDFVITGPAGVAIAGATADCDADGLTQEITLQLNARIIEPGSYQVRLQTGSDHNTLLGACWQETPPGGTLAFALEPQSPALPNSIVPITCKPNRIQVIFSQPVQCNSIAPNGSDFAISGPTPVTITGATGICRNGMADTVELQLVAPIYREGAYDISVRAGSDGSTLISKCWIITPAGASVPFATKDTVNAEFEYTLRLACEYDTVILSHNGANGVNSWLWSSDGTDFSTEPNPIKPYSVFGAHQIQLIVSNGVCSDTAGTGILLENELKADFSMSADLLCPQDVVNFLDKSIGKIVSHYWDFGNGIVTSAPLPLPQSYPPTPKEKTYDIKLVVQNNLNCFDTAIYPLKVVPSCYIDVPNAFTPNRDGQNDYLYPLNGYKAVDLKFTVYNRLGQVIFETNDWTRRWDGTFNGQPQNAGVYVWMLSYTRKDTGEKFFKKGTALLVR